MTLEELFANLSYGVLSNLAVGGSGSGTVPSQHQKKLINHVNTSLTGLYGRFNLYEKEISIEILEDKTEYALKKIHAVTDATIGVDKFILDTVDNPFLEDVLKILTIYREYGVELPVNDPGQETSVFTPTIDSLILPSDVPGDIYYVVYQSLPPKLLMAEPINLEQVILLPAVLVPPLEAHIAYQILSSLNGPENAAKGMEHLSRYEMLCLEIENKDLVTSSLVQTHTKLEDRGFI